MFCSGDQRFQRQVPDFTVSLDTFVASIEENIRKPSEI